MYAINIITCYNLLTKLGEIGRRAWQTWVEIVLVAMLLQQFGMRLEQAPLAHLLGIFYLEGRNGDYPGMKFHPAFMGFLDSEGKRVVARVAVESAGQADIPRLYFARIDD